MMALQQKYFEKAAAQSFLQFKSFSIYSSYVSSNMTKNLACEIYVYLCLTSATSKLMVCREQQFAEASWLFGLNQ